MEKWPVDQVCIWLVQKNLGELVPKFREEEVSGAALLALNDRMVQQLVKKIGHQAVLMDLITKCKQQTKGTTSLQFAEEQVNSLAPTESHDDGSVNQRVLRQKKHMKHVLSRYRKLQWTKSYILPEFPHDIKCILAERKCPDHCMRIRIIEFLQADMTKYLEGSLYPTTQQYNDVVNALLQTYPFLDEDGCGFFLWKRALKDRFKYVRRPIEDDEQVVRYKCKFGHRRGQTRKSTENQHETGQTVLAKPKSFWSSENRRAGFRCDKQTSVHEVSKQSKTNLHSGSEWERICLKASCLIFCHKVENIYKKEFELDVEINEHINWFNEEYMKTERNWEEVNNRMNKTLEIRRKMINNRIPLKVILRLFPFLKCPYQLFREFQSLEHKDIYKKTAEILEEYSDNILTSYLVKNNPIHVTLQKSLKQQMEDDILKFMKMTATFLLLPVVFGEDSFLFAAVNEEVKVSTPVMEVKYPFNVNICEFSLFVEKEKLAQLDDCTMALAALLATYHVFCIPFPEMLYNTLTFLKSLIFEDKGPVAVCKIQKNSKI